MKLLLNFITLTINRKFKKDSSKLNFTIRKCGNFREFTLEIQFVLILIA